MISNRRIETPPKIAPKITAKAKKSDLERRTSAALRAAGLELVGRGGGGAAAPRGRGATTIGSEGEREEGEKERRRERGSREREESRYFGVTDCTETFVGAAQSPAAPTNRNTGGGW